MTVKDVFSALIPAFVILLGSSPAGAASCSVSVSVNGLEFGSYDANAAADDDDTAVITVECTGAALETVNYEILLGAGVGSAGNPDPFEPREMQLSTNSSLEIEYNAYTSVTRGQVWKESDTDVLGNTISGSIVFTTAGTQSVDHVVYGRIPAGQLRPSGDYVDSLQVTLVY